MTQIQFDRASKIKEQMSVIDWEIHTWEFNVDPVLKRSDHLTQSDTLQRVIAQLFDELRSSAMADLEKRKQALQEEFNHL